MKWLMLIVVLATACGHDDLVVPDVEPEVPATPYVELRITVPLANPSPTRANPMGGEEGNGRERGILNEDKVHDINVFFYKDENGMNGDDNTQIDYQLFYNIQNPNDYLNTKVDSVSESNALFGEKYITLKFQYWKNGSIEEAKDMKFLAVANAGPMSDIKTLGALRNYSFSEDNTWQKTYDQFSKNAAKMDYFLMSTAYNTEYKYGGQSTGDNTIREVEKGVYTGVTTLQRMYARLDLWYKKSENAITEGSGANEKVSELEYQVIDETGSALKDDNNNVIKNTVYLTNVLPVNVMKNPSFLFKKVTSDLSSFSLTDLAACESFSWGGKESPTEGPYTTPTNLDRPQNYVMERHTTDKSADGTGGNVVSWFGKSTASTVGNSNDDGIMNTANGKVSDYYHAAPASSDAGFDCDQIAIISYANENTHPIDCFHSNYLTGMAFRAVYVPETIYSGYGEVEEGDKTVNKPLVWSESDGTPTNIYRYSPSKGGVKEKQSLYFTNQAAADAYAKDHPADMAIITEFTAQLHDGKWGFTCYYNLWLRHYNDENADPQTSYPMEYATVRNNIYRVKVSFSGPGDPTPTMREPDTMQARIFVRKWNLREEKNPLDF